MYLCKQIMMIPAVICNIWDGSLLSILYSDVSMGFIQNIFVR
jgi:hypothetical protein